MRLRTRRAKLAAALLILAVVALAAVAYTLFAPERSTRVDQPLPAEVASLRPLAEGAWRDGEPLHHASGTVRLLEAPDGSRFLRFEEYEATAGPDVYFYLVRDPGASTAEEVEGQGLRLAVPGGADDGQATLRGAFNVPLPQELDLDAYRGVVAWCKAYNVLFGSAPLAG